MLTLLELSTIILSSKKVNSNFDICTIIHKHYIDYIPKIKIKLHDIYIRIYRNLDLFFFVDKVVRPTKIYFNKYNKKKGHCLQIEYPLGVEVLENAKINIYECYESELREPTYEESHYIGYYVK